MACGHCRRPRKKQTCHTAFINVAGSRGASRPFSRKTLPHNFPHRCGNPAALLVRSPGKPCHTTFITVAAFRGASRTFSSQYPRAPTTGLLKNPSFCTATREPGREPSREPSKTQPPQGLSPLTLHCLFHDFVGLSPLPRGRLFTRIVNFTPINRRFCVIGALVPDLGPSPPPP